jgi:uncharacterized membrane protein
MITSGYLGRLALKSFNNILNKLPFFKSVYNAFQKMINTLFIDKSAFRKVVIITYPRKGSYAIGFITSEKPVILCGEEYLNVFVPTVPNPTSGFYLLMKKNDVIETDMTIEEGFKIILSAGMIQPEKFKKDV